MNSQNTHAPETQYKVIRFFRTGSRRILERGLTLDEARRCVARFPSTPRSFVGFSS